MPDQARDLWYRSLTDAELLRLLETEEDRLRRQAVDEMVGRAGRMVEPLARVCADGDAWAAEGAPAWYPVHATYVLGAIGGRRVVRPLLDALVFGNLYANHLVTEELPPIFGAIGPGAVRGLRALALDETLSGTARWIAADCLGAVAARHEAAAGPVLGCVRRMAEQAQEAVARGGAGLVLLHFARLEDRAFLYQLADELDCYDDDLHPFGVEWVDDAYARGPAAPRRYFRDWLEFYAPWERAMRRRAQRSA